MSDLRVDPVAWACGACGHVNAPGKGLSALVCESCGLAPARVDDDRLDIPLRPALTEIASFWYAAGWLALLLLGAVALASEGVLTGMGLGRQWVLLEMLAAAYAAGSSLLQTAWDRTFNEVRLVVPERVRTGDEFEATLELVPYESVSSVSVSLSLIDRFYERRERTKVETRSRRLARFDVLRDASLLGRRSTAVAARFVAPFPATRHSDVMAEIMADVLGVVGTFVPALRWNAANLREHGGYVVEARMRLGIIPRRMVKRVFVYHLGEQVHFG